MSKIFDSIILPIDLLCFICSDKILKAYKRNICNIFVQKQYACKIKKYRVILAMSGNGDKASVGGRK